MKDYTLSEIKAICKKHSGIECSDCECEDICIAFGDCIYMGIPERLFDIEPRDMIELPCKIPANAEPWQISPYKWQVIWRGSYKICTCEFHTEAEADAFLEELKGEKQ